MVRLEINQKPSHGKISDLVTDYNKTSYPVLIILLDQ